MEISYFKKYARIKCVEHKPTGRWEIRDGKSYAECKKCGWYKTTLLTN